MKIEAKVLTVTHRNVEGGVSVTIYRKDGDPTGRARQLIKAEIMDMAYDSGTGIPALRVTYMDEYLGNQKEMCEVYPLEYVEVTILGRRW